VAGVAAGALAWRRLGGARAVSRVDLYFEDGSLTSFDGASPEGATLLSLAADLRRASG
jgi:hypothetical protein